MQLQKKILTLGILTINALLCINIKSSDNIQELFRTDTYHFGIPTMQLGVNYKSELQAFLNALNIDHNQATLYAAYFPADNDLRNFLIDNLKGMTKIGSNANLVIVVHLDVKIARNKKVTRWYLVLKDKLVQINTNLPDIQALDSGNPQTLLKFISFCAECFQTKYVAIELADHGSGVRDPYSGRIRHSHERFRYNPETKLLELERSDGFLGSINQCQDELRGMCWDDSTGNYLTNRDLWYCFHEIKHTIYQGKKPDLYILNACFMAMVEIASLIKEYGDILVASEEAVYAPGGWSYQKLFHPFIAQPLDPEHFARHAIAMHKDYYHNLTQDYAFSAIRLSCIQLLEERLDELSKALINLLEGPHNLIMRKAIKKAKSRLCCTHFEEKSYKDLDNFLDALALEIEKIMPSDVQGTLGQALTFITATRTALNESILCNIVGQRLVHAQGLSIYFPDHKIHSSYSNTPFGSINNWHTFLQKYLGA